jgi:hypothetical protein
MSAAIKYLRSTAASAAVVTDALAEAPRNNISYFEAAPEQRLRRALDKINDLQAEVRVLRDELSRTERASSHYERLLKNALVREQELKALVGRHLA